MARSAEHGRARLSAEQLFERGFRGRRSPSKRIPAVAFLALLSGITVQAGAQEVTPGGQTPEVSLYLPADVAPETVEIRYFMSGPFGGYGSFVRTERGRVLYQISAAVDGNPAENMKIIAITPGCEIVTMDIAMQGTSQTRTLGCRPLGVVRLHGRILPISRAQAPGSKVTVIYEADWDHGFFGIADGMVTTVQIAMAIPDANGEFDVDLPDYAKQSELGEGAFVFWLGSGAGGNLVAQLKPMNMPRFEFGLKVHSSYAPFVVFSADTEDR